MWGGASDGIYSVGAGGVTIRGDGAHPWDVMRSGLPGSAHSIVATSPSDFLIGADRGTVFHYLNGTWTEQPLPNEASRVTALAESGSNRFAGTMRGNVYQFDGTNWALSADSLGGSGFGITDLAATPDGGAVAVGFGVIAQFDGTAWKRTYSGTNHFQYVWAYSKTVAFATAYEGVYEFDGASWKRVLQNKQDRYQGIWGTAPNDVYVAAGSIRHFDGNSWINVFPSNSFELITGTGADDVVAWSDLGMARFDGRIWRWSYDRSNREPIDIVPTRDGQILRMYADYRASDTPPRIVISQRVAP
jgi:hypothetical protein